MYPPASEEYSESEDISSSSDSGGCWSFNRLALVLKLRAVSCVYMEDELRRLAMDG